MYTTDFNVRTLSGLSGDVLEVLLVNTGLKGLGNAFAQMEQSSHVNAVFAIAHAFIESARGTSYFAQNYNNIFGQGAFDSNLGNTFIFPNKEASIMQYGELLDFAYLSEENTTVIKKIGQYNYSQGMYYAGGTSIGDIFEHYSTSGQGEAHNVVTIMNAFILPNSLPMTQYKVLVKDPTLGSYETVCDTDDNNVYNSTWNVLKNAALSNYLEIQRFEGDTKAETVVLDGNALIHKAKEDQISADEIQRTEAVQNQIAIDIKQAQSFNKQLNEKDTVIAGLQGKTQKISLEDNVAHFISSIIKKLWIPKTPQV